MFFSWFSVDLFNVFSQVFFGLFQNILFWEVYLVDERVNQVAKVVPVDSFWFTGYHSSPIHHTHHLCEPVLVVWPKVVMAYAWQENNTR